MTTSSEEWSRRGWLRPGPASASPSLAHLHLDAEDVWPGVAVREALGGHLHLRAVQVHQLRDRGAELRGLHLDGGPDEVDGRLTILPPPLHLILRPRDPQRGG